MAVRRERSHTVPGTRLPTFRRSSKLNASQEQRLQSWGCSKGFSPAPSAALPCSRALKDRGWTLGSDCDPTSVRFGEVQYLRTLGSRSHGCRPGPTHPLCPSTPPPPRAWQESERLERSQWPPGREVATLRQTQSSGPCMQEEPWGLLAPYGPETLTQPVTASSTCPGAQLPPWSS